MLKTWFDISLKNIYTISKRNFNHKKANWNKSKTWFWQGAGGRDTEGLEIQIHLPACLHFTGDAALVLVSVLPLWRVILAHGSLRVISVLYNTFDFECEKSDCICFIKCAADVNSRNISCYKDKMLSNNMWDAYFSFAFHCLFPGTVIYRFS